MKAFAHFREMLDKERSVELEDKATARDLLEVLCGVHEGMRAEVLGPGGLRDDVILMRNRKNMATLQGLDTVLDDGDEVAIFPPVAGG